MKTIVFLLCILALPLSAKSPDPVILRKTVQTAEHYGLDPQFVIDLVEAESSFRPDLICDDTNGDAIGLLQLTPPLWEDMVKDQGLDLKVHATIVSINLEEGCAYLATIKGWLEKEGQFSYRNLAIAYNGGFGRFKRNSFQIGNWWWNHPNRMYRQIIREQRQYGPYIVLGEETLGFDEKI